MKTWSGEAYDRAMGIRPLRVVESQRTERIQAGRELPPVYAAPESVVERWCEIGRRSPLLTGLAFSAIFLTFGAMLCAWLLG